MIRKSTVEDEDTEEANGDGEARGGGTVGLLFWWEF